MQQFSLRIKFYLIVLTAINPVFAQKIERQEIAVGLPDQVPTVVTRNASSVAVAAQTDLETDPFATLLADSEAGGGPRPVIVQFSGEPLLKRGGRGGNSKAAMAVGPSDSTPAAQQLRFRRDLESIRARRARPATAGSSSSAMAPAVVLRRQYSKVFNGVAIELDAAETEEVRRLDYVRGVHPDRPMMARMAQSAPLIGAPTVWANHGATGTGVVVAIIDSGVDYMHPDLGAGIGADKKVIGGYDFHNNDADPRDDHGHGTHVAGTVAANGGVKGIAPEAKLMAVKVLGASGSGLSSNVIAGIEYSVDPDGNPATDDGAHVLNLSLGGDGDPNDPTSQAIDAAVEAGVLCCVAAGNDGQYGTIGSPGVARRALTVGATDDFDQIAYFSSRGAAPLTLAIKPEICAPGVEILSTRMGGGTTSMQGTSMATPHVAGAAALLLQLHPDWSPDQIKSALINTAKDLQLDAMTQGAGRIRLPEAAAPQVLIAPAVINLGHDDSTQALWLTSRTLAVENVGGQPVSLVLTIDQSRLPSGITASVTPALELAAGETGSVTFTLSVDNNAVAALREIPYWYEGKILIQCGAQQLRVPFAFDNEQADSFEPNNTKEEATPILLSSERRRVIGLGRTRIDPAGPGASDPDYDWYSFSAEAGQLIFAYADTFTIGSLLNPALQLLDAQGSLLAQGADTGVGRQIAFYRIPQNGAYYLRVSSSNGSAGPYELYAHRLPENVILHWTPDIPPGGNPVEDVLLGDQGAYLYASSYYNNLTLFATDGSTQPLYNNVGRNAHQDLSAARESQLSAQLQSFEFGDDTWNYDGTAWTRANPARSPGRLYSAAMAFDAARGMAVLFGGLDGASATSGRTWTWDGANWTLQSPATSPPERYLHNMAYDSARERVVLFGGHNDHGTMNDTWEWDGTNWTQIDAPIRPSARRNFAMAYDSTRDETLVFGGTWGNSETWTFNGSTWTRRFPVSSPPQTEYGIMAFDAARGEAVLMIGNNETWTWDGTNWTRRYPATVPSLGAGAWRMAYDPARARVVMVAAGSSFSGAPSSSPAPGDPSNGYMETWEWNGTNWLPIGVATAPTRRDNFAAAFDSARSRFVVTGGRFQWSRAGQQAFQLRHAPTASPLYEAEFHHPGAAGKTLISADGSRVLRVTDNRSIEVRDADGGLLKTIQRPTAVSVHQISRDGRLAVIVDDLAKDVTSVYDLETDQVRFSYQIQYNGIDRLVISDDGSRMIQVNQFRINGYQWNGIGYIKTWEYDTGSTYWINEAALAGDGSIAAAVQRKTSGIFGDTGLDMHLIDGLTGKRLYVYPMPKPVTNLLQMSPIGLSVNQDGSLVALGHWGGDRRYGEVVVFSPHCATPLFQFDSPGSAMAMDLYDRFVAMGAKGVHANVFGGGGRLFLADLAALEANTPPNVTHARATPGAQHPGGSVTITCNAVDSDGVSSVTAIIQVPDDHSLATVALFDDGAHGDGAAGDNIWGAAWTTPAKPDRYLVDILAVDEAGRSAAYNNAAQFATGAAPSVRYKTHALQNGVTFAPNNFYYFTLTLENDGTATASGVKARMMTNDPHDTYIATSKTNFGDIADGGTKTSGQFDCYIGTSVGAPHDYVFDVDLIIEDAEGRTWTDSFQIGPIVDNQGPGITEQAISAKVVAPGEPVSLTARLTEGSGVASFVAEIEGFDEQVLATVTMHDDGLHNDGLAGDGLYGATWTTGPAARNYMIDLIAIDGRGNGAQLNNTIGFTTVSFAKARPILLVNGNWFGHDSFVAPYRASLTTHSLAFDEWNVFYRGNPAAGLLAGYDAVIWEAGSSFFNLLDAAQQSLLQTYLGGGGRLVLSGGNWNYSHASSALFTQHLRVLGLARANINGTSLSGVADDPIGGGLALTISPSSTLEMNLQADAAGLFRHALGNTGQGNAALRVDKAWKVVFLSFPFGNIQASQRDELLRRIFAWLYEGWADFGYEGTEEGSYARPFNMLAEGVGRVPAGGTLKIKGDSAVTRSAEKPRLTKRMKIQAVGGAVRLGVALP